MDRGWKSKQMESVNKVSLLQRMMDGSRRSFQKSHKLMSATGIEFRVVDFEVATQCDD